MLNKTVRAIAAPAVTASSAYATGNAAGGKLTLAQAMDGGTATLQSLTLSDKSNSKVAMDVLLFNQSFTPTADKSAIAISAADMLNCVGVISIATTDWATIGSSANAVATKANINLRMAGSIDNALYAQIVVRGTPTFGTTSDLQLAAVTEIVYPGL